MSITEVRNQAYEDNNALTTWAVNPPAAGFASGNLLVAGVFHEDTATAPTITDTDGNTWTRVTTQQMPGGSTIYLHVYWTVLGATLATSDTVTLTWIAAVRPRIMLLREYNSSTGWPANPQDTITGNTGSGTTTTLAIGPTSSTAQAEEVVTAFFGCDLNASTFTPDAGWTGGTLYGGSFSGGQGDHKGYSQYKVTSSAAAQSISVTRAGGASWWAGILAAFKNNAGTPATVTAVPAVAVGSAPGAGATYTAGSDALGYANGVLGAPWLAWTAGAGAASLTISSGVARPVGTLGDTSYPVAIGPDSLMECVLNSAMLSGMSFGAGLRLTAHSNAADGYMLEVRDTGSGTEAVLYKGSAFSSLAGPSTPVTSSTVDAFRMTVTGSTTTTVKGYLRISGVWTEVISFADSSSPYTAAGYPGFWVQDPTAVGLGITEVSWGAASAGTDATVVAVPATALGDVPVPAVSAGVTVSAVPAVALGSAPPANQIISIVVGAPAVVAAGSAPAAAVSAGGTGATVGAVPAAAGGSAPAAAVSSGVTVGAVAAAAAGSAPVASVASGVTVAAVPAVASGQAPRPTISPAPAGGGVSGDVAATFAEASS